MSEVKICPKCGSKMRLVEEYGLVHETWYSSVPWKAVNLPKKYWYEHRKSALKIWRNACLTPESPILTDRGLLPISEVKVGDLVYSKDGRFHKVLEVWKRPYKGKIIRIRTHYGVWIGLTPDHKVMALSPLQAFRLGLDKGAKRTSGTHNYEPRWFEVKDCREAIFAFPKPIVKKYKPKKIKVHSNDPRDWNVIEYDKPKRAKLMMGRKGSFGGKILREVTYMKMRKRYSIDTDDNDFWFFVGVWLAEGSFSHREDWEYVDTNGHRHRSKYIVLSINKHDRVKDRILRIITEKFRRTPQLDIRGNLLSIKFGHRTLEEFLEEEFGRGATSKRIPIKYLGLRKSLLASLIEGLMMGDGTEINGGWTLSTTNVSFVGFLILALLKYNIIPSVRLLNLEILNKNPGEVKGRKVLHKKPAFHLSVSRGEWELLVESKKGYNFKTRNKLCWNDSRYVYVPTYKRGGLGFVEEDYEGEVYDLTVEGEESFATPYIILHNSRNLFIGGGGDNCGDLNPYWVELRQICDELGIKTWKEFEEYLKKGNVDPKLKAWLIKALQAPPTDYGTETRETAKYYFALHPNEITPEIDYLLKHPPKMTREIEIENYVRKCYFAVLGRHPDREGLEYYKKLILEGAIKQEDLPNILRSSKEYRQKFALLNKLQETESISLSVPVNVDISLTEDTLIKALMKSNLWWNKIKPLIDLGRKFNAYLAIQKKAETGGKGLDIEPIETFQHYVEKVKQYMPPEKYPKMLEIGAGAGVETKAFMDAGYDVTGITFGIDNIRYAKEKYNITLFEMDMHDLKFPAETFDCAVMIHTFEHALAPHMVVGELRYVLKDWGRVYIVVPDPNRKDMKTIWHTNLLYPEQIIDIFKYWGFRLVNAKSLKGRDCYEFVFEKLPNDHPDFQHNWGYIKHIYGRRTI